MTSALDPKLTARLEAAAVAAQRAWRATGLSAGVVRDGELVWSTHVGSARVDPPTPATDDTQTMIGSITKTFTAVLVMQMRDEGRLSLDDTLGTWLPDTQHATLTVRQMLSHSSGLQREPMGHLWETLETPDAAELVAGLEQAERVLPGHFAFHYSNLAFALLGQVVEQLDGRPWEQALRARVLGPLGMTHTGLVPSSDHAVGYQVDPFAGTLRQEPLLDTGATAPMGGLWSTVNDMARYAAFLCAPDPAVLRAETLDEMCRPLVVIDPDGWTRGYGLGLELLRSGERIFVGHRGAMPGFLSAVRVRRPEHTGVFAVATTTAGALPAQLATQLLEMVLDDRPSRVQPWVPEEPRPDLDELLGSWWSEGEELILEVRRGDLWMRVPGGTALDETRFTRESETVFRAAEGRERGERLELVRADSGELLKLYFATYAVTRSPTAFADLV